MNKNEVQTLIDSYVHWLRSGLSVEMIKDSGELTTPFLDRHNDHLQVYITRQNGRLVITDDGYIMSDLAAGGLAFDSPKRRAVLTSVMNGFGVKLDKDMLHVEASSENFGKRLHSLMQAMLALNDMYVMSSPRVAGFFWEDVVGFLDQHEIRYSANVKVAGKSGFDHHIDFLIPKSKTRPERFLQVINAPTKSTIANYLFVVTDSTQTRKEKPEPFAILNDQETKVGGDVLEALESYSVKPVLWSQREEFADRLAG